VEKADLTWGLDDPGLVGLGRVAVPLPVRQALHHGVRPRCRALLSARCPAAAAAAVAAAKTLGEQIW
jgi:hypothetical protein